MAVLILALLLAGVMPSSPHRAAEAEQASTTARNPTPPGPNDNQEAQTRTKEGNSDSPQRYTAILQPEWWLVAVGIATFLVIGWQAVETRRATQQMGRSAKAAEDSIQMFIAAQRPQIVVTAHGNPPADLCSDSPRVQMELSNRGPTTALGLVYESWIEVLPFPFKDFTNAVDYHKSEEPISVYPGETAVILNIPLRSGLTPSELHELKRLKKFACIRVKATYRDGFTRRRSWVSFGYWIQSDGLGFLDRYNESGEEER